MSSSSFSIRYGRGDGHTSSGYIRTVIRRPLDLGLIGEYRRHDNRSCLSVISVIDQRGRLLMAALGFAGCSLPSYDRALWAVRTWLDSWPGFGHVAVGMHRQGFDLQLTQ